MQNLIISTGRPVEMDAAAAAGMQKDRLDGAGSKKYPFSRYLLNRLPQALNSGEPLSPESTFCLWYESVISHGRQQSSEKGL